MIGINYLLSRGSCRIVDKRTALSAFINNSELLAVGNFVAVGVLVVGDSNFLIPNNLRQFNLGDISHVALNRWHIIMERIARLYILVKIRGKSRRRFPVLDIVNVLNGHLGILFDIQIAVQVPLFSASNVIVSSAVGRHVQAAAVRSIIPIKGLEIDRHICIVAMAHNVIKIGNRVKILEFGAGFSCSSGQH